MAVLIVLWNVMKKACLNAVWFSRAFALVSVAFLLAGGCMSRQGATPPSDSSEFDKTLTLVITSEPVGAAIYSVWVSDDGRKLDEGEFLGVTPLDVPVSYCELDGAVWFKNHPLSVEGQAGDPNVWSPVISGTEHSLRFYATADGRYRTYVRTVLVFANRSGTKISLKKGSAPLVDGYRLRPFGMPLKLVEDKRQFSEKMARMIDNSDYHMAEGCRLSRIHELEGLLKQHDEKWMTNASCATSCPSLDLELMSFELGHLECVVGLGDAELMSVRGRLLQKLTEGDVESALTLARMVATMEEKYLPEPPEATAPEGSEGARETLVQRKPHHHRTTDMIRALSAVLDDKVDPKAAEEVYGWASMADLMGFAETLNN